MASGFSGGGGPDFFGNGIANGRSAPMMSINKPPRVPYRSLLTGILPEPTSQIIQSSDLIGKRSLAEFQQQQQQQFQFQQQQQQMVGFDGLYDNLRNVKPRVNYQHTSPISPLSPVDFSSAVSSCLPEMSSISNSLLPMNPRYGLSILQQQLRQQQHLQRMSNVTANNLANGNIIVGNPDRLSSSNLNGSISFSNLVQNQPSTTAMPMTTMGAQELFLPSSSAEDQTTTEKNMLNRLHELEKQLLDDDDNDNHNGTGSADAVYVITNSEWSDTIHNLDLITTNANKIIAGISTSPTSTFSSCASTSASAPIITNPKQSIADVASAISEGKIEAAAEILTRLTQVSNVKGTSEQRLTAYMASALRSRVNPTDYPPPVSELFSEDDASSTQLLYETSPCFKLGFMAANLAILEATSDSDQLKLHVIDFDIGQGGQYLHLLHTLAAKKVAEKPSCLKITTVVDSGNGGDRLKVVADKLTALANKIGVRLDFRVTNFNLCDLSREKVGVESDEALAVNFAFRLYKLPDESVTTENVRDELLRRVKGLSPKVVTVVELDMNANTAPFVGRVNEACGYYGVLFDSLDATVPRHSRDRVRIEEGLGRKMANSVACDGRDRVERCEVFGKWRARMTMAGFKLNALSPGVAESLRSKLNSGTHDNPGFTVNEQSGGICFGWMGRTLTVASAWR